MRICGLIRTLDALAFSFLDELPDALPELFDWVADKLGVAEGYLWLTEEDA